MKQIKTLVECIKEEICDAEHYSDMYIQSKAHKNMDIADKYHDMAEDELAHSEMIHQMAVEEIEKLKTVFVPTNEMMPMWNDMENKWKDVHTDYVNRKAWIRKMLDM